MNTKKFPLIFLIVLLASTPFVVLVKYAQATNTSVMYTLGNWEMGYVGHTEYITLDNFTVVINNAGVKTTNATGVHEYLFSFLVNNTVDGWAIKYSVFNGTINTVELQEATAGQYTARYTGTYINASQVVLSYDGELIKFYVNNNKVLQMDKIGQGTLTRFVYSTADDSSDNVLLPAAFSGSFYVTISGYSLVQMDMAGTMAVLMSLVVLSIVLGLVAKIKLDM